MTANPTTTTPDSTEAPGEVLLDGLTDDQWYDRLAQFADGNFYQTRAYGAVSWRESQLSHVILEAAYGPLALAQVRIVKVPLLKAGVAYVRWGPCVQRHGSPWNADAWNMAVGALVAEYANRRGLLLRILPHIFAEDDHADTALGILQDHGFQRDEQIRPYHTIRVDLAQDPHTIRKQLDGKWRNQLNAAERQECAVTQGTGDDLFEQFVHLYDEMMARKQFDTTVDVNEFRRIQHRLPEQHKMIVMISTRDGIPQAGIVATAIGDTGIYLLGATSDAGMKTKGSYLLQWHMMLRLRERGCRWYDLGGINQQANPGVYHFKKGMGGHECRLIGRFSRAGSPWSGTAVATAERIGTLSSLFRQPLKPRTQATNAR